MRAPGQITSRRLLVALLAATVVVGMGVHTAGASGTGPRLRGFVLDPPLQVAGLVLPDAAAEGAELPMVASPGELLLVYFGYTACPDICPTTLSDLAVALRKLGTRADRVEVAMVTVDPERDTGPVLDDYLRHFVPGRYHALRTEDPTRLRSVADAFGAKYEVRTSADGTVEVGHSALVYAVDDQGTVRVAWPFGTSPRSVTKDLAVLLRNRAKG